MLSCLVAAANILVAPEQVCDRYNHDCFAVSMKKQEQIVGLGRVVILLTT